jgi:wnt family
VPNLSREQLELCYRASDVTIAAIEGLEQAVAECQHQVSFEFHETFKFSLISSVNSFDGTGGTARR